MPFSNSLSSNVSMSVYVHMDSSLVSVPGYSSVQYDRAVALASGRVKRL